MFEAIITIRKAQKAFRGAAEILRVSNDDEIQELVNEIRYGKIITHEGK